jgi:hypothetical protein
LLQRNAQESSEAWLRSLLQRNAQESSGACCNVTRNKAPELAALRQSNAQQSNAQQSNAQQSSGA